MERVISYDLIDSLGTLKLNVVRHDQKFMLIMDLKLLSKLQTHAMTIANQSKPPIYQALTYQFSQFTGPNSFSKSSFACKSMQIAPRFTWPEPFPPRGPVNQITVSRQTIMRKQDTISINILQNHDEKRNDRDKLRTRSILYLCVFFSIILVFNFKI